MTKTFAIMLFVSAAVFGITFGALIYIPSKWDKATVLKVCGGKPVVQLQDGTVWLRDRWRAYRVEKNWQELC